jgi:hypothetical protein
VVVAGNARLAPAPHAKLAANVAIGQATAVVALCELRLEYSGPDALRADFESNLRKARAFVAGATGVSERELCELVLVHPTSGKTFSVTVDVVWVKRDEPGAGVGVQFPDFDAQSLAALRAFVEGSDDEARPGAAAVLPTDATDATNAQSESTAGRTPRNVYERVRKLSIRERETMARQGTLPERVALERCFGSAVWEGLLQNPNLTPPEVMRIAKNGSLSQPLVGAIVSNGAWLAKPEVQRALLSNPRVAGMHLDRVLRAMSQTDLARVAQQSSYRIPVRLAAKRLLNR